MAARDVTVAQGLAYPVPARRRKVRVGTGAIGRRGAAFGLIVLMALGSFALWTAIPMGGLWLASQLTVSSTQVSAASALVAVVGMPAAIALGARALGYVELLYMRLIGRPVSSYVPPWRRSLSDSASGPPPGVLDKLMVASVLAAAIAFVTWFFLFAGAPGVPA